MMKSSVGLAVLALASSALADDQEAAIAPVTSTATDVPAHRDGFATAWREVRACLVGAPQWDPDPEVARAIQRVLDTTSGRCVPVVDRALAIARAGADLDAGFHTAWFDVARPLSELPSGYLTKILADADAASANLGVPKPTEIAALPTLAPAPADVIQASDTASISIPIEHQIRIYTNDDRVAAVAPVDPPLGWKASVGEDDRTLRVDGKVIATKIDAVEGTLGAGADRAIVAYADGNVSIIRSHDRGAHWDPPVPLTAKSLGHVSVDDRRSVGPPFDLVWMKSAHEMVWQVIDDPTTLPPARTIPIGELASTGGRGRSTCVTNDAMFWLEDGDPRVLGVTDARGSHVITNKLKYPRLVACANGRVVVTTYFGNLVRCDATACEPALDIDTASADLDRAGHLLQVSGGFGAADQARKTYVIGPTAKRPARVVRVSGEVLGLYAGDDDEPVLLVRVPAGVAKVHP